MFRILSVILFVFSLSFFDTVINPRPAEAAIEYVGMISTINGTVEIGRRGSPRTVPAKVGDSLFAGDNIRTRSGSIAKITLRDNSKIFVAAQSNVRIGKFMLKRKSEKRSALLNLFRGKIRVIAMKMVKLTSSGKKRPWRNASFNVKTPNAVAGVKGTDFIVTVIKGSTILTNVIVIDGIVEVKGFDKSGRGLKTVKLSKLQQTTVGADGTPTPPHDVPGSKVLQVIQDLTPDETIVEVASGGDRIGSGDAITEGEARDRAEDSDDIDYDADEAEDAVVDAIFLAGMDVSDSSLLISSGGGGQSCASQAGLDAVVCQ
ncbi:MAG: FecR domain-containing protein [Deltaproteobacteria bacterium]|nr:FecR domain-containing protein [Deltaproteobacteria bacterium]